LIRKYKSVICIALVIAAVIFVYKTYKTEVDFFLRGIVDPNTTVGWIKYFSIIALQDFVIINPFSPDILVSWFTEQLVPQLIRSTLIPMLLIAGIGALGSTAGALAGYGMGRLIIKKEDNKFLQWFLYRVGGDDLAKAKKRITEGGMVVLLIAAMPYTPFAPFCWAAGMVRMRLIPFILICLIGRCLRFLVMGPLWAWGIL
jgi:membrane protein YqaA with SNARE-associated domain